MVDSREISLDAVAGQVGATGSVVNAWPVTNVDLKYFINLDGEKTNQYVESQELDWQVRQWVKLTLDHNDMADLAPLGHFRNARLPWQSARSGRRLVHPGAELVHRGRAARLHGVDGPGHDPDQLGGLHLRRTRTVAMGRRRRRNSAATTRRSISSTR